MHNHEEHPKNIGTIHRKSDDTDDKLNDTDGKIDGKIMSVESFLNETSVQKLQLILNPQIYYKTKKIILDSDNINPLFYASGKLSWDVVVDENFRKGLINTKDAIKNIICVKFSPFLMWYSSQWKYMLNGLQRYSILIEEFQAQSFLGTNGRRFHFITTLDAYAPDGVFDLYNTTMVDFNKGRFWFNPPITEIKSLTLSFGNPFTVFPLQSSFSYGKVIQSSNPMRVEYAGPFPYFVNTDLITISNFTTGDPVADAALIQQVNSTSLPLSVSTVRILFNFDISSMTPFPGNLIILMKIGRYRTIIEAEITYIAENKDTDTLDTSDTNDDSFDMDIINLYKNNN